jgi:hypothetical protein
MNNEQKMALITYIYNMIFGTPHAQWRQAPLPPQFAAFITSWVPQIWAQGAVRAVVVGINVGNRVLNLKFLEQNPNKLDSAGNLKDTSNRARRGERIMWVIDANQENGFLGSMQNDQWVPSQDKAYQPVAPNTQVAAAGGVPSTINNVPIVPGTINTAEYVVSSFSNEEPEFDPGLYAQGDVPSEDEIYDPC